MNIPGFNVQVPQASAAPFQMLPPEVLAQLAAASFRPPQLMAAPAMPPIPNGGGDGGLGMGLAGLGSIADFLTGLKGDSFKGDPAASAAYGSARAPIPGDVIARRGWIGGGN